jgi:hypothetical protein
LSASKVLTIPFFKKKNTSLNLMNEGQRGAKYPNSISTLG